MTKEQAIKAWEQMYEEIDKENWLFIGTINPQMVEWAIKALKMADMRGESNGDLIGRQVAIDALIAEGRNVDSHYLESERIIYESDAVEVLSMLPSTQIEFTTINKLIDNFEEILAYIRESHGDDSVCGWCEFDGAYIGESGDWCNECPGFNRDDCFKLRDRIREKWITEITNTVSSTQPERKKGEWVWDENGMDWGIGAWKCSRCHHKAETWWASDKKYNPLRCSGGRFCGVCGADMNESE